MTAALCLSHGQKMESRIYIFFYDGIFRLMSFSDNGKELQEERIHELVLMDDIGCFLFNGNLIRSESLL